MGKLPTVSAKKLIRALHNLGFFETRQRGSHKFFKHPDGRVTSVPMHSGSDIGKGLLRKILNQIEISPDEFADLLKK